MPVKSHASQARVSFKSLLSGFQVLFVMPAPWKISHSSMGGIQASFDFKTFWIPVFTGMTTESLSLFKRTCKLRYYDTIRTIA